MSNYYDKQNQNQDYDPAFDAYEGYDAYRRFYNQNDSDDYQETFYGSPGGVDEGLDQDYIFSRVNEIINENAERAKRVVKDKISYIKDDELFKEVMFYVLIFSIKLGLYIALRQGQKNGFIDL